MLISCQQYREMIEQIKTYKTKNQDLMNQIIFLKDKDKKKQEIIKQLERKLSMMAEQKKQQKSQLRSDIKSHSEMFMKNLDQLFEGNQKILSEEFQKIREGNQRKKIVDLKDKLQEKQKKNSDLISFYHELKVIYHSKTKKKNQPSFAELLRWIGLKSDAKPSHTHTIEGSLKKDKKVIFESSRSKEASTDQQFEVNIIDCSGKIQDDENKLGLQKTYSRTSSKLIDSDKAMEIVREIQNQNN